MSGRRPVIALVSDSILPFHRGGKELRYHEVARRLARTADVHVYTMRWWDAPGPRVVDGVAYHALCRRLPLYDGERRSTRQAVVFALACLRLLTRRFDVIEADHMPYLQLFTLRLVATLRRRRLVATWHEVWGPAYWRRYMGRPGRLAWWIERAAMRLPDEIIAASEETGRRLRAHLGDDARVVVAPNGVDLDTVRAAVAGDAPTDLVVVGRLLSHKRVDMLLDAVALLHADGVPVTCRVIGDGPERAALHARADALGIADAVDFRHDVDDAADLYALVKAARVFAFPSEREGFGVAALEALACGVPVVTTSAPDNLAAALVRDSGAGVVCDPDAPALAGAVRDLLARDEAPVPDDAWLRGHDWDAVSDRVMTAVRA
ncbi:glycosyltransferase family 4 protein [Miltoncostaea oceani]|uniref:glycosyltransferase family 4 protein n=1 Tax=Miltoncostaea oceani TaxID=2843216 RepID=UPI001C3C46D6|nr:glycosyltransferase family 4 protein [Miltoncostaea oceani]